MRRGLSFVLMVGASLPGCAEPEADGLPSTLPRFEDATFAEPTTIDNPWIPLLPGVVRVYITDTDEGSETTVVEALDETREVERVESRVVLERVFLGGVLVQATRALVAQDDDDDVWLMGEQVQEIVEGEPPDGMIEWEAGRDLLGLGVDAYAGWLMPATPEAGDAFHQAYYPDVFENVVEVLALDVDVTFSNGTSASTLKTLVATALDPDADTEVHFAADTGKVLESRLVAAQQQEWVGTFRPGLISVPSFATVSFDAPTTIDNELFPLEPGTVRRYEGQTARGMEVREIEVLAEPRVVAGIECLVVHHTLTVGGRLLEDTRQWFAQDDGGNVWSMGEEVDAYAYDEQGNMLEVTHEGSWEAGLDVGGTGVSAAPGHQMPAAVMLARSYHQSFQEGITEHMAFPVASDVTVELPNGTVHRGCVQTLDWTPLEPSALAYKLYAPGVGLVLEVPLGAPDEGIALVSG